VLALKRSFSSAPGTVGGATLTEEFHPGYRNSVFSYLVSLLDRRVIADLELEEHGLTLLPRPGGSLSILAGDHMYLPRDTARAQAELRRFSAADAEAFPAFEAMLEDMGNLVREIARDVPPNFGGGWSDLWRLLGKANAFRKLPAERQLQLTELMTMSIGDVLDRWFESDADKGLVRVRGRYRQLCRRLYTGHSLRAAAPRVWRCRRRHGCLGLRKGRHGRNCRALAESCVAAGADILVDAEVAKIS
jgi:phytoene dehydrogenase-like protein